MRLRIPNEIFSSVLAASTAFIGGNVLNLPVWAIFISWAATYLVGGPRRTTFVRLYPAMLAGSTFALVIVLVDNALGSSLGPGKIGQDALLAVVILVVNSALMYCGRTRLLALVPGMFLGFASYFATVFGGFGVSPHNPFVAWLSVVLMLAIGPLFALLAHVVSTPGRAEPAGDAEPTDGADQRGPAGTTAAAHRDAGP